MTSPFKEPDDTHILWHRDLKIMFVMVCMGSLMKQYEWVILMSNMLSGVILQSSGDNLWQIL